MVIFVKDHRHPHLTASIARQHG